MFPYLRRSYTFAVNLFTLEMKYRILAIAITFSFGFASYIMARKMYFQKIKTTESQAVQSPDNKLSKHDSLQQRKM